jgi:hypothetical protein
LCARGEEKALVEWDVDDAGVSNPIAIIRLTPATTKGVLEGVNDII